MKRMSIYSAMAGAMIVFSSSVNAGVYTDDLSRCLVESSTSANKLSFVKWMFIAISLHPAVKSMSSVSANQVDNSNKEVADIYTRLLTVACKDQAVKAIKYESTSAIQSSFTVFGQVAAKELFSNPAVAAGMSGLQKYFDTKKLNATLGIPSP